MSFNKKFLNKSPLASHGGPHSNKEELKRLNVDLNPVGKLVASGIGVSDNITYLQKNYNKLVDFYNKRPISGSMTDEEKNYRASLYQTINKPNIKQGLKGGVKTIDDIKNISSTVSEFSETLKSNVEGREIPKTKAIVGKAKAPKLVYEGDRRKEIQLRTLGLYDQIENKDKSYYIQSDFGKNFIKPRKAQIPLTKEYLAAIKQKIKNSSSGQIEGAKIKGTGYNLKGGIATLDKNENIVFSRERALSGLGNASKSSISSLLGADDELKQIKNQYSKLFNPVKEKFYLK